MKNIILTLFLCLFLSLQVLCGDELVSSKRPKVWSHAALNTVVLQYTYTGKRIDQYSGTGSNLSLLLHRNLLYSGVKYGPIGATQIELEGTNEENRPNVIFEKLLGNLPGAKATIKPGNIIVFLWGRIYEENDDIYIQSFLRFLRKDKIEKFTWDISDQQGNQLQLDGVFPSQAIAFAPRKLSRQSLDKINSEFEKNATLRKNRDLNEKGQPFSKRYFQSNAYQILSARDNWMQIELYQSGKKGWVYTGANLSKHDIRHHLPELYFTEAVSGYLRFIYSLDNPEVRQINVKYVYEAINNFEQASKRYKSNEMPQALAKMIKAHIDHLTFKESPEKIANILIDASKIVPENADASNLSICGQIYSDYKNGWSKMQLKSWKTSLMNGLSIAPANYSIIKNLENVYQLAFTTQDTGLGISKSEIKLKQEQVKNIRLELENRNK